MITLGPVRIALCLCLIASSACRKQAAEEVETTTAVTVTTATAERGTIRGAVHATGVVAPAPDAELIVVGITPRRYREEDRVSINAALAARRIQLGYRFVDISADLDCPSAANVLRLALDLQPLERPRCTYLMQDALHLASAGYAALAKGIRAAMPGR